MSTNQLRKQKSLRKTYSLAIVLTIAVLIFQHLKGDLVGYPPISAANEGQENAAKLNAFISVALVLLAVPYVYQLLVQILIKLFLFPFDLYFYGGSCNFNVDEANHIIQLHEDFERAQNNQNDLEQNQS